MATRCLTRSLFNKQTVISAISRCSYTTTATSAAVPNSLFLLRRLRPLVAASTHYLRFSPVRTFASRQTASSLNDPNPNWTNRPPKETILLDGCDFEHWLVVMEKPEGDPTRDEIIDSYIKTLAMVVGSEEEARMKIYSVSTRHYFAFGALVSEELSYKLKELPRVRWVLPDSYLDVKNKDYGGEPFINGQAVPYDPKYHEEWVRNNARANERNRRNDRPRNFDRSRNFERRREMQQTPNQNTGGNFGGQFGNTAGAPNVSGPPPNAPNPGAVQPNTGTQPNYGGVLPNNPGNYGMPNNAPNYGPNSGRMPYQSGAGPNPSGFGPNIGPAQGQQPNPSGFAPNMGPGQGQQPNPSGFAPHMGPGQGQQANPSGFAPPHMGPGQGQQANPSGFAPPHMGPGQGQQANAGGVGPPHMGPAQSQQQGGYAPNGGGFSYQNQNAPNRGYSGGQSQSNYVPNAVSDPGPNQNTYNPNNAYVPNAGGGNAYQNQNVPGRDY